MVEAAGGSTGTGVTHAGARIGEQFNGDGAKRELASRLRVVVA